MAGRRDADSPSVGARPFGSAGAARPIARVFGATMVMVADGIVTGDAALAAALTASARHHAHGLCPRQVLGARIGLHGAALLGIEVPVRDKRLVVVSEIDGCFLDGLAAATGCRPGNRTLRIEEMGKVAATFVDTRTGAAIRLRPAAESRSRAAAIHPDLHRWHAQRAAYQTMLAADLIHLERVTIDVPSLVGAADHRVACARCGEEILNGRERLDDGAPICRTCAGDGYYTP